MSSHDERLTGAIAAQQGASAPRAPRAAAQARPTERRAHGDDALRDDRAGEERYLAENRELTDDERLAMFRAARFNAVLPDLPEFDGYHVCWLTTSNPRDSIPQRMRMGYELITVDMCPAWDGVGLKVGPIDNVVGVNEMVAARLPRRLYTAYMKQAHHVDPLSEEEALRATMVEHAENARRIGARVENGDGMEALAEKVAPPTFRD